MSDPMSNREIEDVLSSIRRLVTQGDAQPAAAPSSGKLVLTPAFRVAEAEPQPPAGEAMADPAAAISLEQTIAELEAAISAYGGPFEPDEGEAALPRPESAPEPNTDETSAGFAAPSEPAPLAEAASEAPAKALEEEEAALDDPVLDGGDPDEMVFDEAMLRELVTDILREELQGALGQRITRNVRKLVRAEIARALASRDLS
jgi:cell pole-organizing protein PopZ